MFLNYLKEFFVKKLLENSLLDVKAGTFNGKIETVGLIIDESYFNQTQQLISELAANGIVKERIELLLYKSKSKENLTSLVTKLESGHLNWKAQIKNQVVNDFLAKDFDLLISYYDVDKAVLLVATHESKAKFKVGFSTIDKRFNNLMINTNSENYKIFVQELFRYLKILNKK
ncbi:hypothetical protein GCM10008015_10060 [Flavobacterium palustre]|uniref:Uncharacterized protein n=1 Tax=Flavobacterium palustre TaxID=1476463 RepID=A0ABQ1HCR1_9FLAO|nr:hypothetical protein [Flavobacterium palustre]GGA71352.1 hypothetical protein GCM10008015_10060 [Flavobacterium palustre]